MKKLILGLLLTVGVTGVSFAGEIKLPLINETIIENFNKNEKADDFEILCTHAFYENITDCAGKTVSLYLGSFEGSCSGSENGSIIMHVSRHSIEEISDSGCI